jgi:glutamate N-acetyltransferase / amino-acid N-acetyltransferase
MEKQPAVKKEKFFKAIPGGVTAVRGVVASGVASGLKPGGELDLALIVSEVPCRTAAFFTTNKLLGAHIPVMREKLVASGSLCSAVLINSKNANCSTGAAGIAANKKISADVARRINVPADQVLYASTGVIGVQLPVDKIIAALPKAVAGLSAAGGVAAARAIMTTDTRPKSVCFEVCEGKKTYRIGGVAKGSGMICPNMATLLVFVFTDADVPRGLLTSAARRAMNASFNAMCVDNDMSPNDTLLVMANGCSGVKVRPGTPAIRRFEEALQAVCRQIAMELLRDGEGATKILDIRVVGAANDADARVIARAVANSQLVKTALFGEDPNWGRIISAAGSSGAEFDPNRATLEIGGSVVYRCGRIGHVPADLMKDDNVAVRLDVGKGRGASRMQTCDLSTEYVRINADYTT